MAREELKEARLEEVVGGKFSFYTNSKGEARVNVTDIGVYACVADGFTKYIDIRNENPDASEEELFDLMYDAGYIWGGRLA